MERLNSTVKDKMITFIKELTTTDITPNGCRVKSIMSERSHRGKIWSPNHQQWTNVVIKFHEEDMKNYMNRKNLTLPVPDKLVNLCNELNNDKVEHIWKCIISGALHKSGFFSEDYQIPEADKSLF
jgi:hypothetical protein